MLYLKAMQKGSTPCLPFLIVRKCELEQGPALEAGNKVAQLISAQRPSIACKARELTDGVRNVRHWPLHQVIQPL